MIIETAYVALFILVTIDDNLKMNLIFLFSDEESIEDLRFDNSS
jgi:hypothetical protein